LHIQKSCSRHNHAADAAPDWQRSFPYGCHFANQEITLDLRAKWT
jgi:hypothetical protein